MYVVFISLVFSDVVNSALISDGLTIDSLHIRSDIRHRFSETRVSSRISNNADIAQDATFDIRLPKEAFISAFSMLIGDVIYPGHVEEKGSAARQFQSAVQSGHSAGKVAKTSARDTNDFVVNVNVAARSNVMFSLTYQELLQRRLGLYEHVIHINPGQVVPDLRVEVFINETREITELTVPEVTGDRLTANVITGGNRWAQIRSLSPTSADVTFSPTPEQQEDYSSSGVSGQFIVNYDVDHNVNLEGEILVSDGYFVHFFAPDNLPPVGKRIVFVLDTSGSMSGRKNLQLREALLFILGQLRPVDEFTILLFSDSLRFWNSEGLIPATVENIARAKQFAKAIGASGGTDINAALLAGLQILSYHETKPSMLLFLTDGEATSGVTDSDVILANVRAARHTRQSIYSLAFGTSADFKLLRRLSLQNKGFARKIVEDADAALQLAGFYNEISTPLLSEVKLKYIGDLVDKSSLTKSDFATVFSGSEIMVAGRYNVPQDSTSRQLTLFIENSQPETSESSFRRLTIPLPPLTDPDSTLGITTTPAPSAPQGSTSLERLWVYLTVKQLIEKTLEIDDPSSKEFQAAKAEALRLSLKYQFVTPYTSMIVTGARVREGEITTAAPAILGTWAATTAFHLSTTRRAFQGFTGTPHRRPALWGITRAYPRTTFPRMAATTNPPTPTIPPAPVFPAGIFIQQDGQSSNGPLCLDLVASGPLEPSRVVLLNDTTNRVEITGILQPQEYDRHRKLLSVSVRINGSDILTVALTSLRSADKTYRWWQLSSLTSRGFVVSGGDTIETTILGNVNLVFQKYGIESRRSLSSPFISVAIKNGGNLSQHSSGALASALNTENRLYQISTTTPGTFTDGTECNRITDPTELRALIGPLTE